MKSASARLTLACAFADHSGRALTPPTATSLHWMSGGSSRMVEPRATGSVMPGAVTGLVVVQATRKASARKATPSKWN